MNIGVICYLKQLLDTGFFHADPHPGNLIRTPDGRLAILDFGLMTNIDDNIKFGMIEAIAHLIHRDYDAIVEDFVTLDFIPEGVDLKPILPPLARVFDQALEGGGAKNINFQEVAADLAQITFDYPFRIPPYFALIIRAIGVLEEALRSWATWCTARGRCSMRTGWLMRRTFSVASERAGGTWRVSDDGGGSRGGFEATHRRRSDARGARLRVPSFASFCSGGTWCTARGRCSMRTG